MHVLEQEQTPVKPLCHVCESPQLCVSPLRIELNRVGAAQAERVVGQCPGTLSQSCGPLLDLHLPFMGPQPQAGSIPYLIPTKQGLEVEWAVNGAWEQSHVSLEAAELEWSLACYRQIRTW